MVTSGGSGTMGYGLPAAIGAQLAAPSKIVVDIDGDASFLMSCTELATAAQYNIPVKVRCKAVARCVLARLQLPRQLTCVYLNRSSLSVTRC
jgi:glyoxylate carboligase